MRAPVGSAAYGAYAGRDCGPNIVTGELRQRLLRDVSIATLAVIGGLKKTDGSQFEPTLYTITAGQS
jgi:hypothetical protein